MITCLWCTGTGAKECLYFHIVNMQIGLKDVKWGLYSFLDFLELQPWWFGFVWAKKTCFYTVTFFYSCFKVTALTVRTRALLCRVEDSSYWSWQIDHHQGCGVEGLCFQEFCVSHSPAFFSWPNRFPGLWMALPWNGGNTIVMVPDLERPLGLPCRFFFFLLVC